MNQINPTRFACALVCDGANTLPECTVGGEHEADVALGV